MKGDKFYSEEWKEYLVNELKACAKVLDDNAEEIIGKYLFTGDLDIMITIDTNGGGDLKYPSINISKSYYPDYKLIAEARQAFDEKRKSNKKYFPKEYSDDDCGDDLK